MPRLKKSDDQKFIASQKKNEKQGILYKKTVASIASLLLTEDENGPSGEKRSTRGFTEPFGLETPNDINKFVKKISLAFKVNQIENTLGFFSTLTDLIVFLRKHKWSIELLNDNQHSLPRNERTRLLNQFLTNPLDWEKRVEELPEPTHFTANKLIVGDILKAEIKRLKIIKSGPGNYSGVTLTANLLNTNDENYKLACKVLFKNFQTKLNDFNIDELDFNQDEAILLNSLELKFASIWNKSIGEYKKLKENQGAINSVNLSDTENNASSKQKIKHDNQVKKDLLQNKTIGHILLEIVRREGFFVNNGLVSLDTTNFLQKIRTIFRDSFKFRSLRDLRGKLLEIYSLSRDETEFKNNIEKNVLKDAEFWDKKYKQLSKETQSLTKCEGLTIGTVLRIKKQLENKENQLARLCAAAKTDSRSYTEAIFYLFDGESTKIPNIGIIMMQDEHTIEQRLSGIWNMTIANYVLKRNEIINQIPSANSTSITTTTTTSRDWSNVSLEQRNDTEDGKDTEDATVTANFATLFGNSANSKPNPKKFSVESMLNENDEVPKGFYK